MKDSEGLDGILNNLPALAEEIRQLKEIILTNAVMVAEIPAPTQREERRVRFLCDRFTECGISDISTDEESNVTARIPGEEGKRNILIAANADSVFTDGVDHTVSLGADVIDGVGLGDNALGVAALVTLPSLLEHLGVKLRNNLILTAASRTLGRADLQGFNFFLDHVKDPIDTAVCIRGSELGRISYSSLGAVRGQVTVAFEEEQAWARQNFPGAIVDMEAVLHKILSIPVPQTPKTSILLGSINAGATFNTAPSSATLQFEIRSEDAGIVQHIEREIDLAVEEVDAGTTASVKLSVFGRREPGALAYAHPMPQVAHDTLRALDLQPRVRPSAGLLSSLISRNIPAITIGLTERAGRQEVNETMKIAPLFKGLAQLISLIRAIDSGYCHE